MVTIAIASLNTRVFTELAIRTALCRSGIEARVLVGDSQSTDGTLEMLARLGPRYVSRLEIPPAPRTHGEWLDHWIETLDDDLVVFTDSDVEFRRSGWLRQMLDQQQREAAAIVTCEWVDEWPNFVEPVGKQPVRLSSRPAPWVQLVHRPTIQALGCSYKFCSEPTADVPEGVVTYDIGAVVAARATAAGHTVSVMPTEFRRYYHHYGGRSWSARGKRARLDGWVARARLARFRALRW